MRDRSATLAAVGLILFLASACSNPSNYELPTDLSKAKEDAGFKSAIEKLTPEDKKALLGYLLRSELSKGFGGQGGPAKTIGEAVQAQRTFETERKAKEEAEAALKAKVEAEAAAARKVLDNALTVAVTSKSFTDAEPMAGRFRASIDFTVAVENKTTKAMKGVKGGIQFKDMFGDPIMRSGIGIEEEIPPGKSIVWQGSVEYNQFMAPHQKLAQTPLEKLKVEWHPVTILFVDGTDLKGPEGT